MEKDPVIFLKHILESIEWIEKDVADLSREEFFENVPMQDAVIRRLEILGEAIRNLPSEMKESNSEVPWQDIVDMRNSLIHGYFGVDLKLVWDVVVGDVPLLKKQVKKILSSIEYNK